MLKTQNAPLLLPALSLTLGLILARCLSIPLWVCIVLTMAGVGLAFYDKRLGLAGLVLAIIGLGALRLQLSYPVVLPLDNHTPRLTQVSGRLLDGPQPGRYRERWVLQTDSLAGHKLRTRLLFYTADTTLALGDEISGSMLVKGFSSGRNPGAFAAERYYRDSGFSAVAVAPDTLRITGHHLSFWQNMVEHSRTCIMKAVYIAFGGQAPLAAALLIGERADLNDMQTLLTKAGILHIISVSGLHVGILALALSSLLGLFLHRRWPIAVIMIIALVWYAALCRWQPAVVRAGLILAFLYLARAWQRPQHPLQAVSLAWLVALFWQPAQLFTPGFLLSYTAYLSILYWPQIAPVIARRKLWQRWTGGTLNLLGISLFINLTTLPITAWWFHQLNFNGVLVNLVAVPLSSLLLPVLVLALPGWAHGIFATTGLAGLNLLTQVGEWGARLPLYRPGLAWHWPNLLLYVCGILLIIVYRKRWPVIGLGVLLLISGLWLPVGPRGLVYTFIDCGQGDAAFFRTPEGRFWVVDTGPPPGTPGEAAYSLIPALRQAGAGSLDTVIITHPHDDHAGGLPALSAAFSIRRIITPAVFMTDTLFVKCLQNALIPGGELLAVTDTLTLYSGAVKIKILHPDRGYIDDDANSLSLVDRVEYGNFSLLSTADIDPEAQQHIMQKYPQLLPAKILKAPHHGSALANGFIGRVSPELTFVSVGYRNRYHLPQSASMQEYARSGEVWCSSKNGALTIIADADGWRVASW